MTLFWPMTTVMSSEEMSRRWQREGVRLS